MEPEEVMDEAALNEEASRELEALVAAEELPASKSRADEVVALMRCRAMPSALPSSRR